jgi:hypothetical protein
MGETSDKDAQEPVGATASFPYDRMTVQHFRDHFPRARWSDERKAWFIPGKTAGQRFQRWLERENEAISVHADARGKDAYRFDPIHSPYLQVRPEGLVVTTPYSRTVIALLREVPFATWEPGRKGWIVPFRSYEELRKRWAGIEEAARRNEPEQRKARAAERREKPDPAARLRSAERRRRRHPLLEDDLPPLERPVMSRHHGVVVFDRCDGELVEPELLGSAYPDLPQGHDYVWGYWRPATLEELIRTWPAKTAPPENALWWQPSIEELRIARKAAKGREARIAGKAGGP